jgi:hypothetical protein
MDLNKDRLWTAYSETVTKINTKRKGLLTGPLYKQMQRLVFDTACAALMDTFTPPTQPRMQRKPPLAGARVPRAFSGTFEIGPLRN